jgi:hypothetical protein
MVRDNRFFLVILFFTGLLIGYGVSYYQKTSIIDELKETNSEIESEYNVLLSEYSGLKRNYTELSAEYDLLSNDYDNLTKKYQISKKEVSSLQSELDSLNELMKELASVEVLVNRDYYTSIIGDLRDAEESISVVMYSMKYDEGDDFDWANDLIQELVFAKNRGVSVEVYLEYTTFFDSMYDNLDTYYYLSENGVNVRLDYEDDTDHSKMVIIDNKIVYLGSHNWTESGLYHNKEVSVKLTNPPDIP